MKFVAVNSCALRSLSEAPALPVLTGWFEQIDSLAKADRSEVNFEVLCYNRRLPLRTPPPGLVSPPVQHAGADFLSRASPLPAGGESRRWKGNSSKTFCVIEGDLDALMHLRTKDAAGWCLGVGYRGALPINKPVTIAESDKPLHASRIISYRARYSTGAIAAVSIFRSRCLTMIGARDGLLAGVAQ